MRTIRKLKMKEGKHSKMYKDLKKGLDEAIEMVKCEPEYSSDGRKNHYFCGDKGWPTMTEMLADWDKEKKEKWKKMTPEQRKKVKEKEKINAQKEKERQKKQAEKYAKQRAKKGYADIDIWAMDQWMLEILPKMVKELKGILHGWPDTLGYKYDAKLDDFVKLEKYQRITPKDYDKMLDKFVEAMEDYRDFENFAGKYDYELDSKEQDEYLKNYKKNAKVKKDKFFKYFKILFNSLGD